VKRVGKELLYLFGIVIILFFPVRSRLVPETAILVVDELGHGINGVVIEQTWAYYSISDSDSSEVRKSDENGKMIFPARIQWYPWTWLIVRNISGSINMHRSYGCKMDLISMDGMFELRSFSSKRPPVMVPDEVRIIVKDIDKENAIKNSRTIF
jgi:hypothetical protein